MEKIIPKVSVVIPIYNAEKYLSACLDSVLAQTLRDIEILCVDDGSTDRSPEILDDYSKRDSRIRVFRQPNAGPGAARNRALDRIAGTFVLFVDADDAVVPELAERTVDVAEKENADMTVFFMETNHANKKLYDRMLHLGLRGHRPGTADLLPYVTVCAKLWRADFLERNKLRFADAFFVAEDMIFHWAAIASDPNISFLFKRFYRRSTVPDSLTYAAGKHGRYANVVAAFERIRENLVAREKYDGEWKRLFLHQKMRSLVAACYQVPTDVRPLMVEEIRRGLGEDEREFLRSPSGLPWHVTAFYRALDGSRLAAFHLGIASLLRRTRDVVIRRVSLFKERWRKSS